MKAWTRSVETVHADPELNGVAEHQSRLTAAKAE